MKTLIKNGLIYDGSLNAPCQGDVLIAGDKIEAVGINIKADCVETIDAGGRMVTPGFIDMHRHADLKVFFDDFGALELAQGITSIGVGMCGLSVSPYAESSESLYNFIMPMHGPAVDKTRYPSLCDYIGALKKLALPVNVTTLQGLAPVRIAVKGHDSSPYTAEELQQARAYIQEAIACGVPGFTVGLVYQPDLYTSTQELIQILSVCKGQGLVYMPHMRNEAGDLPNAVSESISIAKAAGMALNISHFKALGPANWGKKIRQAIAIIEKARNEGFDITVDFHPYNSTAATLAALLPPDFVGGDLPKTLRTIACPEKVAELRRIFYGSGYTSEIPLEFRWANSIISSVTKPHNQKYVGKLICDCVKESGAKDEVEFICNILGDENGMVGCICFSIGQDDINTVARLPYSMVISDSLYDATDTPHPRLLGAFPRIIRKFVLEDKTLTMSEAIHKMTQLPAARLKLKGRGVLAAGSYADILIFDPQNVRDMATFECPKILSRGIDYVFVNGRVAWKDGALIGKQGKSLI